MSSSNHTPPPPPPLSPRSPTSPASRLQLAGTRSPVRGAPPTPPPAQTGAHAQFLSVASPMRSASAPGSRYGSEAGDPLSPGGELDLVSYSAVTSPTTPGLQAQAAARAKVMRANRRSVSMQGLLPFSAPASAELASLSQVVVSPIPHAAPTPLMRSPPVIVGGRHNFPPPRSPHRRSATAVQLSPNFALPPRAIDVTTPRATADPSSPFSLAHPLPFDPTPSAATAAASKTPPPHQGSGARSTPVSRRPSRSSFNAFTSAASNVTGGGGARSPSPQASASPSPATNAPSAPNSARSSAGGAQATPVQVFCRFRPLLTDDSFAASDYLSFTPDHSSVLVLSDVEKTDSGSSTSMRKTDDERTTEFKFQHVFHPRDGQEEVYERMIDQGAPTTSLAAAGGDTSLLSALFRGHNITLLAYGQTGTGKTWSVEGPTQAMVATMNHASASAGAETVYAYRGLIPRLVENIFRRLQEEHEARVAAAAAASAAAGDAGATDRPLLPPSASARAPALPEVSVHVSFFELYRSKIRDLLAEGKSVYNEEEEKSSTTNHQTNPSGSPSNGGSGAAADGRPAFTTSGLASPPPSSTGRALQLLTRDKQVIVAGLSERSLTDSRGVLRALKEGQKWRTVGRTKANAFSSRGHAVFDVFLKQTIPTAGVGGGGDSSSSSSSGSVTVVSRLRLVDLAGSEQNLESGGDPERLLEARSINRSLTFLGKVITSLSHAAKHVNYRDSLLTRVLQTSFGGNAITMLLVTCSPARHSLRKTVNTLRFGSQASNILNAVTVNRRRVRGGADGSFGGAQNFSLPAGHNPEVWEEIQCWSRLQTLNHQEGGLKAVPMEFVRALLHHANGGGGGGGKAARRASGGVLNGAPSYASPTKASTAASSAGVFAGVAAPTDAAAHMEQVRTLQHELAGVLKKNTAANARVAEAQRHAERVEQELHTANVRALDAQQGTERVAGELRAARHHLREMFRVVHHHFQRAGHAPLVDEATIQAGDFDIAAAFQQIQSALGEGPPMSSSAAEARPSDTVAASSTHASPPPPMMVDHHAAHGSHALPPRSPNRSHPSPTAVPPVLLAANATQVSGAGLGTDSTAVALLNQQLHALQAEYDRMSNELEAARQMNRHWAAQSTTAGVAEAAGSSVSSADHVATVNALQSELDASYEEIVRVHTENDTLRAELERFMQQQQQQQQQQQPESAMPSMAKPTVEFQQAAAPSSHADHQEATFTTTQPTHHQPVGSHPGERSHTPSSSAREDTSASPFTHLAPPSPRLATSSGAPLPIRLADSSQTSPASSSSSPARLAPSSLPSLVSSPSSSPQQQHLSPPPTSSHSSSDAAARAAQSQQLHQAEREVASLTAQLFAAHQVAAMERERYERQLQAATAKRGEHEDLLLHTHQAAAVEREEHEREKAAMLEEIEVRFAATHGDSAATGPTVAARLPTAHLRGPILDDTTDIEAIVAHRVAAETADLRRHIEAERQQRAPTDGEATTTATRKARTYASHASAPTAQEVDEDHPRTIAAAPTTATATSVEVALLPETLAAIEASVEARLRAELTLYKEQLAAESAATQAAWLEDHRVEQHQSTMSRVVVGGTPAGRQHRSHTFDSPPASLLHSVVSASASPTSAHEQGENLPDGATPDAGTIGGSEQADAAAAPIELSSSPSAVDVLIAEAMNDSLAPSTSSAALATATVTASAAASTSSVAFDSPASPTGTPRAPLDASSLPDDLASQLHQEKARFLRTLHVSLHAEQHAWRSAYEADRSEREEGVKEEERLRWTDHVQELEQRAAEHCDAVAAHASTQLKLHHEQMAKRVRAIERKLDQKAEEKKLDWQAEAVREYQQQVARERHSGAKSKEHSNGSESAESAAAASSPRAVDSVTMTAAEQDAQVRSALLELQALELDGKERALQERRARLESDERAMAEQRGKKMQQLMIVSAASSSASEPLAEEAVRQFRAEAGALLVAERSAHEAAVAGERAAHAAALEKAREEERAKGQAAIDARMRVEVDALRTQAAREKLEWMAVTKQQLDATLQGEIVKERSKAKEAYAERVAEVEAQHRRAVQHEVSRLLKDHQRQWRHDADALTRAALADQKDKLMLGQSAQLRAAGEALAAEKRAALEREALFAGVLKQEQARAAKEIAQAQRAAQEMEAKCSTELREMSRSMSAAATAAAAATHSAGGLSTSGKDLLRVHEQQLQQEFMQREQLFQEQFKRHVQQQYLEPLQRENQALKDQLEVIAVLQAQQQKQSDQRAHAPPPAAAASMQSNHVGDSIEEKTALPPSPDGPHVGPSSVGLSSVVKRSRYEQEQAEMRDQIRALESQLQEVHVMRSPKQKAQQQSGSDPISALSGGPATHSPRGGTKSSVGASSDYPFGSSATQTFRQAAQAHLFESIHTAERAVANFAAREPAASPPPMTPAAPGTLPTFATTSQTPFTPVTSSAAAQLQTPSTQALSAALFASHASHLAEQAHHARLRLPDGHQRSTIVDRAVEATLGASMRDADQMRQMESELADARSSIHRLEKMVELAAAADAHEPAAAAAAAAAHRKKHRDDVKIAELQTELKENYALLGRSMHARMVEGGRHGGGELGHGEEKSEDDRHRSALASMLTPPLSPIAHSLPPAHLLPRTFFEPLSSGASVAAPSSLPGSPASSMNDSRPPSQATSPSGGQSARRRLEATTPSPTSDRQPPPAHALLSPSGHDRSYQPLQEFGHAAWELDQARKRTGEARRRMQEMLEQTLPPSNQQRAEATFRPMALQTPSAIAAQVSASVPPFARSLPTSSRFTPLPSAFRDSLRRD